MFDALPASDEELQGLPPGVPAGVSHDERTDSVLENCPHFTGTCSNVGVPQDRRPALLADDRQPDIIVDGGGDDWTARFAGILNVTSNQVQCPGHCDGHAGVKVEAVGSVHRVREPILSGDAPSGSNAQLPGDGGIYLV